MQKHTRKVLFTALKAFLIVPLPLFAAVIGIIVSTGVKMPVWLIITITLLLLAGSVLYSLRKNKVDILPDDIKLNDDLKKFTFTYDTPEDCKFLNQSTKPLFGKDYVEDGVAESWRKKNPKGFLCLKDENNNIYGGITVLSFKESCMKCFLNGSICENDIGAHLLNDFKTSQRQQNLYIALIILLDAHKEWNKQKLYMILWGFLEYLKKYYNPDNNVTKTVYAMPLNPKSLNMLKRFGFTKCTVNKRKDNHEIYSLKLTAENLDKASLRIHNLSNKCELKI